MPAPGSIRAILLYSLLMACAWVVWRAVSFIQHDQVEFGVGATRVAGMQLWYPVARGSVPERLYAAISLDALAYDAPPARTTQPRPVLIYFGGWPGTGLDNRELIRALVENGFVVAVAAEDAGAPAERPMDFSSNAAYQNTLQRADERVKRLGRQAVELVDRLDSLNLHDPTGRFAGRLDLTRVGIFGYSFGGAVAAQAAWMDERFRAVLNLDGWSFGESAQQGIHQPYLYISDATPMPTEADSESSDPVLRNTSLLTRTDYPRLLHNLARNRGVFIVVEGTVHSSFVDRGRASRLGEILGVALPARAPGKARMQQIMRTYALAFFRSSLLGVSSKLLTGPASQFPEVQFHDLRPLAPAAGDAGPVCVPHQGDSLPGAGNIRDGNEKSSCNQTQKRA